MIEQVEILNFRAIHHARVRLVPFQVLVGPNGCGKSTFFDAIHIVRDILTSGLDKAVFGDLRFDIQPRASDPMDLTWMRRGSPVEIALDIRLPEDIQQKLKNEYQAARYELALETRDGLRFQSERLWLRRAADVAPEPVQRSLFPMVPTPPEHVVIQARAKSPQGWRQVLNKIGESGNDHFRSETSNWNNLFRLGPGRSALGNLPEDEDKFPAATWVKRFLMEGTHRLQLNAQAMRLPSPAGSPREFLPDGSNLPWVVHELEQKDPARLAAWVEHLATAIDDVRAVRTREKPEDRSRYLEVEYGSGLKAPSWLLSDGTLRALALTLLAYAPYGLSLVLIEEPENGVHPRAVESVMQSLSSVYDAQLFCATHSPLVLSLVKPGDLLCFGKTAGGAVDIVRGTDHPRLKEWRSAVHLGDLFAAGVLG